MGLSDKKTLVKENIISAARLYDKCFLNYSYLLCSQVFHDCPYYIVVAYKSNFRHLTGVNTKIPAIEFYDKAYDGVLSEDDFEFVRRGCTERDAMDCAVNKLKIFPHIADIFKKDAAVEENSPGIRSGVCSPLGEPVCTM